MHQSFKTVWAMPERWIAVDFDDGGQIGICGGEFIADRMIIRFGKSIEHVIFLNLLIFLGFGIYFPEFYSMNNLPPLAERMRPKNLDDYVGQKHLVGKGAVLRKAIESGALPSMIFWGPPGVGKTTLGYIISQTLYRPFFSLSAINSGVKDVREVIEKASQLKELGETL